MFSGGDFDKMNADEFVNYWIGLDVGCGRVQSVMQYSNVVATYCSSLRTRPNHCEGS